jgi:hypothetical protein
MLMHKMLLFIKKTDEEEIIEHFNNFTLKYLTDLAGKEIKAGKIESNFLLETKYTHFCEIEAESKHKMDELMSSRKGRILNKDLMDFHEFVDVIFVDFH